MTNTITTGATVYVASDLRYLGRGKIDKMLSDGTVAVRIGRARVRAAVDQCFTTAASAKANVKAYDPAGLSALAPRR